MWWRYKRAKYMTESEVTDEILNALNENRKTSFAENEPPVYRQALNKMLAYDLIEYRGPVNLRFRHLKQNGYDVLSVGGFDKWIAASKKRENEIHQATIGSEKHARQSKIAAWVAAIAAVIAVLIPLCQWRVPKHDSKTDSTLNALHLRVTTIDSLLQVRLPVQKPIEVPKETRKTK